MRYVTAKENGKKDKMKSSYGYSASDFAKGDKGSHKSMSKKYKKNMGNHHKYM